MDISPLLYFYFWEPVYYKVDEPHFPSESPEKRGRFVGIAEHVGHAMTFKVLTDDTKRIIYRSGIRSAVPTDSKNRRAESFSGENTLEPPPLMIKDRHDSSVQDGTDAKSHNMPIIDIPDLIGRTFLLDCKENGEKHRARIVEAITEN